ncbi:MAG: hypothetical protein ACD_9C00318G0003, partial [uncultured bacterium]
AKINEVLKFAIENEYSDFYRKKYRDSVKLPVTSFEDFQKIPFLEKSELLETRVSERTFVEDSDVSYFSFSSGTTKSPLPLIMPRMQEEYNSDDLMLQELGVSRIVVLLQPTSSLFKKALLTKNNSIKKIAGNIQNLHMTAKIMQELNVDGVMTTPTVLNSLLTELISINFDLSQIKWVSIGSEFCSSLNYNFLRSQFENAYFRMRYGSSETGGGLHYRCKYLAESGLPNVFHINTNKELIEVLDENGIPIDFGDFGEFVHTDLFSKPAPLIRYKMSDIGSLEKKQCPCGNDITLTIGGKKDLDVMKLHGATIYAELIRSSLEKVRDVIEPFFQMHVFEKIQDSKPKPQLILQLKLRQKYENENKNEIFVEILKEKISSNLKLSANQTLTDFVQRGLFLPLEIEFVSAWKKDNFKTKNIISHLK